MSNIFVQNIINKINNDFGNLIKIGNGNSLFQISSNEAIIYFRYSKLFLSGKYEKTFYGLRQEDIKLLQGKKSFICFVWNKDDTPLLIPFSNYESYFLDTSPSSDGQYKTQIYFKPTGTELYIANIGKFNVDSFYGINQLYNLKQNNLKLPKLSHSQVQSLLGAIGIKKGYELWFPSKDRLKLDNTILDYSKIKNQYPIYDKNIINIISEIDVIWFQTTKPISFFEVEHSTTIYSGLLRFNDVLLTVPDVDNFNIVAENEKEAKFSREIQRPTFKQNKLIDKVTFLDYGNIFYWYYNLFGKIYEV